MPTPRSAWLIPDLPIVDFHFAHMRFGKEIVVPIIVKYLPSLIYCISREETEKEAS